MRNVEPNNSLNYFDCLSFYLTVWSVMSNRKLTSVKRDAISDSTGRAWLRDYNTGARRPSQ